MERRVQYLEAEVATLKEEIGELRGLLARLRIAAEDQRSVSSAQGSVLDSPARSVAPSLGSYSVVTGEIGEGFRSGGERQFVVPPRPTSSVAVAALSWEQRVEVCQRIGSWFRAALAGEHRGRSGRDSIVQASSIWVVAKGFSGEVYSPVRIFRSFSGCRELTKRGASCGSAVFIGLPTEEEARVVVAAAGLEWPSA